MRRIWEGQKEAEGQQKGGSRKPRGPAPNIGEGALIRTLLIDLNSFQEVSGSVREEAISESKKMLSDLPPGTMPTYYPLGVASFCIDPASSTVFLNYQIGPLYGRGSTYDVIRGPTGVELHHAFSRWAS